MVVVVPEHGGALKGDRMQVSGLRDIHSHTITDVPVGVNFFGMKVILRLFFCSGIRHFFTLFCAFRRILSACNRCIFLTILAGEFHPCGLVRAQIAITAA